MRLLHLEDSIPDAQLVARLLQREWPECQIHRVDRRAEFAAALDRGEFDVIVSDYSLPDFDGLSALELTRAARPQTPFIFLSGTIGEERAVNALRRGATDYVIKDHLPHLVPVIRQALAYVEEAARRRRSEEALRQNEERFRTITENVADLIAMFDLAGRRIYTNPAYCAVLGEAKSLHGTDSFLDIHPEDRQRARETFRAIVHTGMGHRAEYRLLLPEGRVRHIEAHSSAVLDANGCIVSVLEVSRDVTERRKAELRLREQGALLDKARDAIIATDADLRITYWNASAERLYGWSVRETMGRKLNELGLRFDEKQFADARAQLARTGEWRGEFRLQTKTGKLVQVESTWSLVAGAAGETRSILFIDTEVTERKQLEAALLRTQRLESIGTLAGGVAHDLNNVLTPILLTADLLYAKVNDDEGRALIGNIESSAQHGAALVRQLLAFARGADGERAPVKLDAILPDLENLIRTSLPQAVSLMVHSGNAPWPVLADVTQLKQVLVNLCINARDAMPAGGKIEIRTENRIVDHDLARLHPGTQSGPFLVVAVADTGVGIPPEIAERIFDPFFTTKPVGKGTGLGLSTVSGIIKNHGGFLQMASEVGQGTVFRIFLPALAGQPATPPARPHASETPPGSNECVLVVDDEPVIRSVLKAMLERSGFRVILAADGAEGLNQFTAHRAEINLVITDMNMPVMNGAELIRTLRSVDPAVKIVILSGSLDSTPFDGGVPGPAIECLAKPPVPAHLIATIRRTIALAVA